MKSNVVVVLAALFTSPVGLATTISIDNVNAPGVGFNDTTPVSPIAGNTGTTLGQQRLNVFQAAANQWASLLNSSVPIAVEAAMVPLDCSGDEGLLGHASPTALVSFPGAPRASTTYVIAEADALAGYDMDPGTDAITTRFNLSVGEPDCIAGMSWWYGTDPSVFPPPNTFPLYQTVLHELGHGLGFTSGTDNSGNFLGDTPVWAYYLYDTQMNLLWKDMTSAQRLASSTNDPHLVWTGPRTNKQAAGFLRPNNALLINTPAGVAGTQQAGTATFGPAAPSAGITGNLVLVNDGTGTVTDACEPIVNASDVAGNIALIDRGTCNFTVKTKNAQDAGAIAVLIVDNTVEEGGLPLDMQGSDPTITITSYAITQSLGTAIEGAGTVNVTFGYANIGVNQGCVRMFSPNPFVSGSSVSHFHVDELPDLLMRPTLSETTFFHTDLTVPLFADIDWSVNNADDFIFFDNFDTNPCQNVQP